MAQVFLRNANKDIYSNYLLELNRYYPDESVWTWKQSQQCSTSRTMDIENWKHTTGFSVMSWLKHDILYLIILLGDNCCILTSLSLSLSLSLSIYLSLLYIFFFPELKKMCRHLYKFIALLFSHLNISRVSGFLLPYATLKGNYQNFHGKEINGLNLLILRECLGIFEYIETDYQIKILASNKPVDIWYLCFYEGIKYVFS